MYWEMAFIVLELTTQFSEVRFSDLGIGLVLGLVLNDRWETLIPGQSGISGVYGA